MAYAFAVRQFFNWSEQRSLQLEAIRPTTVAAYVEQLGTGMAKPSVSRGRRTEGTLAELYGSEAPARLRHDLLIRAVAYRVQERALGSQTNYPVSV